MDAHENPEETAGRVFSEYVVRVGRPENAEFDSICQEHPELVEQLRKLHSNWQQKTVGATQAFSARIKDKYGTEDPSVSIEDEGETPTTFADEVISRLASHKDASTRYRIKGEVARGGMGAILRVWDADLRRHLAMKIILGSGESSTGDTPEIDPNLVGRFLEEAQITGQLNHPGVVPVHELGLDENGRVYFTMRLVKGRELKEIIQLAREEREGWNLPRALSALLKVCEAVAYAHDKGVIHRDLKPANVMVGKYGEVYVMDWGLAKMVGQGDRHDLRLTPTPSLRTDIGTDRKDARESDTDSPLVTMDGTVVGTPAYMAPEQARGELENIDRRSDVYAVGAMLYELLTGRVPFVPPAANMSARTLLLRVLEGPPKPVHEIASDVSAELEAICDKAMAREREERYADMGELAVDVRAYMDGRVVRAHATGTWAETKKWVQRNKPLAAALVAVALSLVAGLATTLVFEQETRRERDNVLRLSALQRLEDLHGAADALWPVVPDRIDDFREWLERAQELIDGLDPDEAEDDPGHRAQLASLRARALPRTPEEDQRDRESHPRIGELRELEAQLAALRAAHEVRGGTREPAAFELDPSAQPADAMAINNEAWLLVDPERTVFGREAEGLAMARIAMERLGNDPEVGDTLAWALFAVGRDDEAIAASREALAQARAEWKEEFEGYVERLEEMVRSANGDAGAQAISDLEAQTEALRAMVGERRTFKFTDEEDRWWHAQLVQLVAEIETFADGDEGLIAGNSSSFGWGVARRLAFAEELRDDLAPGGEHEARWKRDLPAIRAVYPGLVLSVQVGLVPIGADPDSGLWEFWHQATGEEPLRGREGKLALTEESGVVLVLMPGGSFWMGAQSSDQAGRNFDAQAHDDESPVHEVTISPHFLSKYEMTFGQWNRMMSQNPDTYRGLHPVEQVSWLDCMKWLPRMGLALPSEAQWEYGARAGTDTPWWTGEERESLEERRALKLTDQAGGSTWSAIKNWPKVDDGAVLHAEVGTYAANAFGLHEVHGNLWEWCLDEWLGFYAGRAETDPVSPWQGAEYCINRGGCFSSPAEGARSANRGYDPPSATGFDIGVRPARAIDP